MSTVIPFKTSSDSRREFIFQPRTVKLNTRYGETLLFPCIGLYHRETGIPAGYPAYERWLFDVQKSEYRRSNTLRAKAMHLCSFLNYILWHTDCDRIHEVTLNDLRNFMTDYRETANGNPRDPAEWARGINDVFRFLYSYIEHNRDVFDFRIAPSDLINPVVIRKQGDHRRIVIMEANRLFVKPPKKTNKKYRLLLHGHLDLLLFEARKYDPMILPGIMLQAYAGIREGEVVNLSMSGVSRIYAGFGRIGKVVLDLTAEADFARNYSGKSEFGSIKVYRRQEVFPDFIDTVVSALDEHEQFLSSYGYSTNPDAPLLVNRRGRPMSVTTYKGRLKSLFMERFIPDLKKVCERDGTWAENAPYIEAYEREYPGAHMLRHWFTMYLLQYTTLRDDEVAHWRGDSNIESMQDYIHVNAAFIRAFRESIFTFQRQLLEDVL